VERIPPCFPKLQGSILIKSNNVRLKFLFFPTCPLENYVMQNTICTYNMRWVAYAIPILTIFILNCIYPSNYLLHLPKWKRVWNGVRFGNFDLKLLCVWMTFEVLLCAYDGWTWSNKRMHLDPMIEVLDRTLNLLKR